MLGRSLNRLAEAGVKTGRDTTRLRGDAAARHPTSTIAAGGSAQRSGPDMVYGFAFRYPTEQVFHHGMLLLNGSAQWASSLSAVGARGTLVHNFAVGSAARATLQAAAAAAGGAVELLFVNPSEDPRYAALASRRTRGDPSINPYQSPHTIRYFVLRRARCAHAMPKAHTVL